MINKDIEFNVSNICFLKLRTGFHTYLCQDDSTDKIQNEYMDAIEIFQMTNHVLVAIAHSSSLARFNLNPSMDVLDE